MRLFFYVLVGGQVNHMAHRETRNGYENCNIGVFSDTAGKYDIPVIQPLYELDCHAFIGFDSNREKHLDKGIHFFLHDYQFERVWRSIERYTEILSRPPCVLAPDFSPYADFPKIIQIYNHYRKHYCAAFWQLHGLTVIPTITWSYPESYDFCFDGEPQDSIVAVSSVSVMNSAEGRQLFLQGFEEMMNRLHPRRILFNGKVPDELKDLSIIEPMKDAYPRYRKKRVGNG